MNYLAFICLILAMLCALGGSARALAVLWSGAGVPSSKQEGSYRAALRFIEQASGLLIIFFVMASLVLVYALATFDFSLVYVANYTDRLLPLFYRLTAFWAGQAGSMLFWALSVAICGGFFQFSESYKKLSPETRLWFWVFYLGIIGFFGLILITWNNPFLINHSVPRDGNGLNPLLQNPGMIFHPPLLFLGYGGFVIPGCLALAQAASTRSSTEPNWIVLARPFTLSAWAFLTAGIVLGGWWAYMELGWGGYWAWDPVENASLIPWLVSTAALHTSLIQTRRNKLHSVNIFLMALTTLSAFFATYLVRSGVVQSVHAFGEGGVGTPLLLFILFSTVISLWLAIQARDPNAKPLAGLESREGLLVLTCWLFLALSTIILIATMWPVFTVFWKETIMGGVIERTLDAAGHDHGGAVGLTAAFYNRVCLPLFAGLILLLSICPWLDWKGGFPRKGHLYTIIGVLLSCGAALYSQGYTHPVALAGMTSSIAVIVTMLLLLTRKDILKYRPSLAACGIHLGLAMIGLGIAFSGPYKVEVEPTLAPGERVQVGPFEATFVNLYEGEGPGYIFIEGELEVRKNGKLVGIASPQRRLYQKWNQMQFAEAAVIPSLGNEFYASLMAVDKQGRAVLRLSANPLVNWLWIGGTLMCLLPFVGIGRVRADSAETAGKETEKKV